MRDGCHWWLVLLLVAGCGGSPAEQPAGGEQAATPTTLASPEDSLAAGAAPDEPVVATGEGAGAPAPTATKPDDLPDWLTAASARRFLAAHPEALILDVRNPDEWNDDLGHIEGARLIPLPELESRLGEITAWKDKPIVVVCRVGGRSRTATDLLRGAGYVQAMNMDGGMLAWRTAEKVSGQGR